jgi:hypothetical protein
MGRTSGKLSSIASPPAVTRSTTPPVDVNAQRMPPPTARQGPAAVGGHFTRLSLNELEPLGRVAARGVIGWIHPVDHPGAAVGHEQGVGPRARLPSSTTTSLRSSIFSGWYAPVSQTVTVPLRSSPLGCRLRNVRYSRGWSSVSTAKCLRFGVPGQAPGEHPRHQDALVLEAQIPLEQRFVI